MFRSYRLLIAATVGLTLLDPVYQHTHAQPRTADSHKHPEYEIEPPDLSSIESRLDGISSAVETLKDNPESKQNKQRAENDLKAQQEMAKWAFWMFVATAAAVVLTLVGLVLIWRTLRHTKRAADYTGTMVTQTKDATEAALTTAETTKQALELSERPYIYIKILSSDIDSLLRIDDYDAARGFGTTFVPSVKFEICNFGKTPAILYRAYGTLQLLNGVPDDRMPHWRDDYISITKLIGMIGAQDSIETFAKLKDNDNVDIEMDVGVKQRVLEKKASFWFLASCLYMDGLGVYRRFSVQYQFIAGETNDFALYKDEDQKFEGEVPDFW